MTGKGLMNRAYAYKAVRDQNRNAENDDDAGVNMGLYNYPILMAVDILIMEADVVPGRQGPGTKENTTSWTQPIRLIGR